MTLLTRQDLHIPAAAKHADSHVGLVTRQQQVELRAADPKVGESDVAEKRRRQGVLEAHLAPRCIDLETEARLEKEERRASSPGLGRAGERVEGGALTRTPRKPAEQLREAMEIHEDTDIEESA